MLLMIQNRKKRILTSRILTSRLYFMVFLSVFYTGTAFAHKVMIFAWVEGDTVYTESKFSGGKKAMGAKVLVYDSDDHLLLEGKTDKNGELSFKTPQKTALKIVLNAGMGHMNKWDISADEFMQENPETDADNPAAVTSAEISAKIFEKPANIKTIKPAQDEYSHISKKQLQKIIDASLDNKLKPVIKMLSDMQSSRPHINEIIGGIGYIIGLAGVAAYFSNRKKKNK